MNTKAFIERHLLEIQQGGRSMLYRKMKFALRVLLIRLPLCIVAVPVVLVIRLIRPWLLVRFRRLNCARLGHFVAEPELYLCEQDAGINSLKKRHLDFCYMAYWPICNHQLAAMWKRIFHIWPSWFSYFFLVNRLIPGGADHEIRNNTQVDRDVHNLLDRLPAHLKFSSEEEDRGETGLRQMGISPDTPFVCLNVRDDAWLAFHVRGDWSCHDYRNSDVQNYVLAAEELANRGYFVIRMGAKVREVMKTAHPRVIDYATNGMRSDFMDIYLGAKCKFCISTGSGFDSVPYVFRRPIVFVNLVPLGYISSFNRQTLTITKHHYHEAEDRNLKLSEIFIQGVGLRMSTSWNESKGIGLIENTPEEIRDVVIEMAERLDGTWQPYQDDDALQRRFWDIFPTDAVGKHGNPMHGEIRGRFGAQFLRNNPDWLK